MSCPGNRRRMPTPLYGGVLNSSCTSGVLVWQLNELEFRQPSECRIQLISHAGCMRINRNEACSRAVLRSCQRRNRCL